MTQGNWIGHVIRGKGTLTTILESTVERQRTRGKKRVTIIEDN